MIKLTKLRDLDLMTPPQPGRPRHLSAASGLVCGQSSFHVIADDELHLAVFDLEGTKPGSLIRLFDGILPDSKKDRKKTKPDFEALIQLPPHAANPCGALLAVPSGSRPNRMKGALLPLNSEGAVAGASIIDLQQILQPLTERFAELNIEGAIIADDELCLFQRRNAINSENAVIAYPLSAALEFLGGGSAPRPTRFTALDLGMIEGIPLGVTDAAALPHGEILITAVAENTDNTYDDGPCSAAAIGCVSADGRLRWLHQLEKPYKIEGVDAHVDGDALKILLVTDADDPMASAELFSTTVNRHSGAQAAEAR